MGGAWKAFGVKRLLVQFQFSPPTLSEYIMSVRITASKPCIDKPGYQVACKNDDPDADWFRILYPGMGCSSGGIEAESLHSAEILAYKLKLCYEAGKYQAMKELREFIGVKE